MLEKRTKKYRDIKGKERKILGQEIRRLIGKSKTDIEMCEELGIKHSLLIEIKKELLAVDSAIYGNLSSVAVMQDFVEKSRDNIVHIDQFFTKFKNRGQWSALVAGIKVKQEIHKDCIKLGQDLGFIDKKSGELKVTGEIGFSTMAESEVMDQIQKEMDGIKNMLKRKPIGMRSEILDVVGTEVQSHLPAIEDKRAKEPEVLDAEVVKPKRTGKKVKAKFKVQLKKRI